MYGISSNVAGPEEHSRYYEAYKTFFRENIKDKGVANGAGGVCLLPVC